MKRNPHVASSLFAFALLVGPLAALAHEPHSSTAAAAAQVAPYDLRFIDTMRAHHEQGIQMAQMAERKAASADVRAMAEKMIADQRKDEAEMMSWRQKWYGSAADAHDMSLPGASAMSMDMSMLSNATGHDVDHHFLTMMMPHHEGAIAMARDAAGKATHAELRRKAQQIADKQQREIATIKKMQTAMSAAH